MKTKNSYLTGCLALLIALSSCTKNERHAGEIPGLG